MSERSDLYLRLDVRHYETIVAIIECGTMTEASRALSVTQSALSRRLGEAERRLGVSLFARAPDRRLTPTNQGIAVYQAAVRALGELARLESSVVAAASHVRQTVRVAVGSYEAYHWFPGFLRKLRSDQPDIDLDLIVVGDEPGPALASREVDLVLAPGKPVGEHTLIPAFDDELVFLCAPDHRLAGRERIEAADIVDETYLTYNLLPSPGFEYDRFVRPGGQSPQIVRAVRQTSAVVELVAADVGVTILSRWATAPVVRAGRLWAAQCGDGLPIEWNCAVRPGDDVAADVADRLRQQLG